MITIKEIAEQLGVSATTVSNVLNGRACKMSAQTRQRVEEALLRNHYVHEKKNEAGEHEKKPVAVYFCMGDKKHVLTDPFCGEFLEGIDRELRKYGRDMICGTVRRNEELEERLKNGYLEGAILLGCEPEYCGELVRRIQKPIVFVDSGEGNYYNIGLDDEGGAYEMTSYLIQQGHEKIAFFCDQKHPIASNQKRWTGFLRAMGEHNKKVTDQDYYYLPFADPLRHEILRQFVKKVKEEKYTAAFFISDFLANEGINVFCSQGLQVPEDISVTGFDDNIYARLSKVRLTTIRQSPEEKGTVAAKFLIRRIYGQEIPVKNVQLPTELIVRESVKNIGSK